MKTSSILIFNKCNSLIVFLCIALALPIIGQNNLNCPNTVKDSGIYEENILGEPFTFSESYLGKNFYCDNWSMGNIVLENGETIYNKILNYHLITHQLIWKRPSDHALITVEKSVVREFTVKSDSGSVSLFRKTKIRPFGIPDSVDEFMQILSQGYFELLAYRKVVIGKNTQTAYPTTDYYFRVDGSNIDRLKLSRSNLYSAVKENRKLMKKIIRSNHLRIRKEVSLIKAINLFNNEIASQMKK